MFFKGIYTILGCFPGTASVSDAEQLAGLYEVVEGLVGVFHAFMKDVGEYKEDG